MDYLTEFPNVPRLPREPDEAQIRRLNLIAVLVLALLGFGLVLSPAPAAPFGAETASYGD